MLSTFAGVQFPGLSIGSEHSLSLSHSHSVQTETILKINRKSAVKYSVKWILHNIWIFLIWADCFLTRESKNVEWKSKMKKPFAVVVVMQVEFLWQLFPSTPHFVASAWQTFCPPENFPGENYQEAKQLISHSFNTWFAMEKFEVPGERKNIYQIFEYRKSFFLSCNCTQIELKCRDKNEDEYIRSTFSTRINTFSSCVTIIAKKNLKRKTQNHRFFSSTSISSKRQKKNIWNEFLSVNKRKISQEFHK